MLLINNFYLKAVSQLLGHSNTIITANVYFDKNRIVVDCENELQSYIDKVKPEDETDTTITDVTATNFVVDSSHNKEAIMFKLESKFKPSGDQPEAIEKLVKGIENGEKYQVLLGATGTEKTFTIANVIERVQKPTLVLAHNKTLAGQLYSELKELFPNNAVCYFVSYYSNLTKNFLFSTF